MGTQYFSQDRASRESSDAAVGRESGVRKQAHFVLAPMKILTRGGEDVVVAFSNWQSKIVSRSDEACTNRKLAGTSGYVSE